MLKLILCLLHARIFSSDGVLKLLYFPLSPQIQTVGEIGCTKVIVLACAWIDMFSC